MSLTKRPARDRRRSVGKLALTQSAGDLPRPRRGRRPYASGRRTRRRRTCALREPHRQGAGTEGPPSRTGPRARARWLGDRVGDCGYDRSATARVREGERCSAQATSLAGALACQRVACARDRPATWNRHAARALPPRRIREPVPLEHDVPPPFRVVGHAEVGGRHLRDPDIQVRRGHLHEPTGPRIARCP